MAHPVLAVEETSLGGLDQAGGNRHDGAGNGRRQDPIVGVSDAYRASVRDEVSVFFGKKIKESMVNDNFYGTY